MIFRFDVFFDLLPPSIFFLLFPKFLHNEKKDANSIDCRFRPRKVEERHLYLHKDTKRRVLLKWGTPQQRIYRSCAKRVYIKW